MKNLVKLANAYNCRDVIARVGGKFDGATKTWSVTDEQLAKIVEFARISGLPYSNKRDAQFARDWARVEVQS